MAGGTNVDIGTGTIITFATSAFTADLLSVDLSGITRESIETSHMGTAAPGAGEIANKTFIPGDLTDPGEISIEIHFNPETTPPIDAAAEVITITWPLAAGQAVAGTWASSGFMTDFTITDPLEDKMTATATIKLSGPITLTAGTT